VHLLSLVMVIHRTPSAIYKMPAQNSSASPWRQQLSTA